MEDFIHPADLHNIPLVYRETYTNVGKAMDSTNAKHGAFWTARDVFWPHCPRAQSCCRIPLLQKSIMFDLLLSYNDQRQSSFVLYHYGVSRWLQTPSPVIIMQPNCTTDSILNYIVQPSCLNSTLYSHRK